MDNIRHEIVTIETSVGDHHIKSTDMVVTYLDGNLDHAKIGGRLIPTDVAKWLLDLTSATPD